jgi:hypothetical protein
MTANQPPTQQRPQALGESAAASPDKVFTVTEVDVPRSPDGAHSVLPRSPGNGAGPTWQSPIKIWAKSECLDARNYFLSGYPEYDGTSWPFGFSLAADPTHTAPPYHLLFDPVFDRHVASALKAPWQYSRLKFAMPLRRDEANFTIRNVGRWQGDDRDLPHIVPVLPDQRVIVSGGVVHVTKLKTSYALTPFCIIAQSRRADAEHDGSFGDFFSNHITLFYTFETFIQECLAVEARKRGLDRDTIVRSYQNVYCNAHPPDAIPSDPAQFPLAQLAASSIDWNDIRVRHAESRFNEVVRGLRHMVFFHRLETHLMVAVAASLHGLENFERVPSRLVHAVGSPPKADELAAVWLRHALGDYDYKAECDRLLVGLAARYGHEALPTGAGPLRAGWLSPRTDVEHKIAATLFAGVPNDSIAFDYSRWWSFEAGLDEASLQAWSEKVKTQMRVEGQGYVR